MILGQLPAIKKLLTKTQPFISSKKLGKKVELSSLEVVQLFHVSPAKNCESILTYGLVPKSKLVGDIITYGPRIFVSTIYDEIALDYVGYEMWTCGRFICRSSFYILMNFQIMPIIII